MKIDHSSSTDKRCQLPQHVDPRVRRTRQLLEDAFRTLVRQKSLAGLSVQDITDHAMVNRATFYAHYTDKHDLASSVLRNDLRHTVLKCFNERPLLTSENMVEIATAVFGFLEALYSACPETASELAGSVGNTLQEELYDIIETWLSADNAYLRLFPNCSKATVATVISWSIYGGALRWSRSSPRAPAAQVCREIVSILLPASR
jgi:AcrR family transcriptional regulator